MKKTAAILILALTTAMALCAQTAFVGDAKTEYQIINSTSLGASVKMVDGHVLGISSGTMTGKIVVTPKNGSIKFSGRKINYDPANLVIDTVENSCIIKGSGRTADTNEKVSFQIIEDREGGSINMIIEWPDFSAARIIAQKI